MSRKKKSDDDSALDSLLDSVRLIGDDEEYKAAHQPEEAKTEKKQRRKSDDNSVAAEAVAATTDTTVDNATATVGTTVDTDNNATGTTAATDSGVNTTATVTAVDSTDSLSVDPTVTIATTGGDDTATVGTSVDTDNSATATTVDATVTGNTDTTTDTDSIPVLKKMVRGAPPPGERKGARASLGETLSEAAAALARIAREKVRHGADDLEQSIGDALHGWLHGAPPRAKPLTKHYEPAAIEQRHYQRWEDGGWFAPRGDGRSYCIMIPPPNVTGSLHMGHAFQDTVMDALIRRQRMCGRKVLWQAGSDHAGIATQMVVERQLEARGESRKDMGRDAFIEKIWEWKNESGGAISRQLRRMGASLDWSRERFTMDDGLSAAVTEVFVQLYREGLIYRGSRLVNWDPILHTAISDLEVAAEEEDGHLWHIRYPVEGEDEKFVVVATTRPETMLGDSAVAVHPDDERYKDLVGCNVVLPLTGRAVPVVSDNYVDPEFGSGCVKITPAHDFNDYEVGQRHALPMPSIFNNSAEIDLPDSPYHGLPRDEARKKIVADLEKLGLIQQTVAYKRTVPRGDRSGAVIEPHLTEQWFVKAAPLARPATEAVENGTVRFVPDNWKRTYFEWMNNLQDWCISRQIWWGHRIPAWYDDEGGVFVARNEDDAREQARAKHGCDVRLRRDEDVLDTWFSSALWPFSTLGWPRQTAELKTFYPTSVLVTGFDIIFFWVARMMMMGIHFTGQAPFSEIYIHGLVRDHDGSKMSKSKGNVLDPLDLIGGIELETLVAKRTTDLMQPQMAQKIEQATRAQFPDGIPAYGADALRFTFASMATLGRDIRFDLGRVEGYRNFCNKLWNAARFVLMNTEGHKFDNDECELGTPERWIISRLQQTEAEVSEAFDAYRLDLAAQCLYSFAWDEYCSWYLELSKTLLNDAEASAARKAGARRTLIRVLETLLRLLHPLMPFITEEIWLRAAPVAGVSGETIMLRPWPQAEPARVDAETINEVEKLKTVVGAVRNIRGEMNLDPGKLLPLVLQGLDDAGEAWLERNRKFLLALARASSVEVADPQQDYAHCATALADGIKVMAPLDAADRAREQERLAREREKLSKELTRTEAKLADKNFVERAPAEVVEKTRRRVAELERALKDLG